MNYLVCFSNNAAPIFHINFYYENILNFKYCDSPTLHLQAYLSLFRILMNKKTEGLFVFFFFFEV